jgi:hypothetical protein
VHQARCGGLDAWRDVGALEGLEGTGKEPGAIIERDRGCTCWCVFVKIW